jgi:hypothetical protein
MADITTECCTLHIWNPPELWLFRDQTLQQNTSKENEKMPFHVSASQSSLTNRKADRSDVIYQKVENVSNGEHVTQEAVILAFELD